MIRLCKYSCRFSERRARCQLVCKVFIFWGVGGEWVRGGKVSIE